MAVLNVTSLVGQSMVGSSVVTPWEATGTPWEVTQGWGRTSVTLEPAGHGEKYWHAGVDLGMGCGTLLVMPHGLAGKAVWLDNPGGYGTGLIVKLANVDVYFGHLRQRLVADGQQLRGGEQLALTNSTGSSTGCHLHFEVRPTAARYGTDIDPTPWCFDPVSAVGGVVLDTYAPNAGKQGAATGDPFGLQAAAARTLAQAIATAQIGLGGTMMLGGLVVVTFGLRGQNMGDLQQAARSTWRRGTREVEGRRKANAAEAAGQEKFETRGMSPEELAQYRIDHKPRITMREKLRQRPRHIGDPARTRRWSPTAARRDLGDRIATGQRTEGPIDVEGGLERVRAARLSRVRPSHQKAATVLRDSKGQVIPF